MANGRSPLGSTGARCVDNAEQSKRHNQAGGISMEEGTDRVDQLRSALSREGRCNQKGAFRAQGRRGILLDRRIRAVCRKDAWWQSPSAARQGSAGTPMAKIKRPPDRDSGA